MVGDTRKETVSLSLKVKVEMERLFLPSLFCKSMKKNSMGRKYNSVGT